MFHITSPTTGATVGFLYQSCACDGTSLDARKGGHALRHGAEAWSVAMNVPGKTQVYYRAATREEALDKGLAH